MYAINKIRFIIGSCLIAFATISFAQTNEDSENQRYVSFGAMLVSAFDSKFSGQTTGIEHKGEVNIDKGIGIAIAYGIRQPNGFRIENEFSVRETYLDTIKKGWMIGNFKTIQDTKLEAKLRTIGFMVNGYYDPDNGKIHPYIGVGLGFAHHKVDEVTASTRIGGNPRIAIWNYGRVIQVKQKRDSDTVFAYQLMTGITIPTSSVDIQLGYRYFGTGNVGINDMDYSYGTHSFEVRSIHRF